MDLSKCQCDKAGFCPVFDRLMGNDPPDWKWCQTASVEDKTSFFNLVCSPKKFKINEGKAIDLQQDYEYEILSFRETAKLKKPENFQFIVKSFMRHHYLIRLIKSIRRWYPNGEILIVDDGPDISEQDWKQICEFPGIKFWHTEFDIGLPAGRNLLADMTDKKYAINCDDDFIFTNESNVDHLIKIIELEEEKFDIVTGGWRGNGKDIIDWHGDFEFVKKPEGLAFKVKDVKSEWKWVNGIPYRKLDLGFNYFIAKSETLKKHRHDPRFKISAEHMDRFITWYYEGLKVAQVASSVVGHSRESIPEYCNYRRRKYHDILTSKWNFIEQPDHKCSINPYNSGKDQELISIKQLLNRPNIVLMTVGHTGSSVVSSMMEILGWNLSDADEEYSESVTIRNANINNSQSQEIIDNLEQPWLIKDPRFCEKLDLWKPYLDSDTVLLWLTKDYDLVKESYKKRNESIDMLNSRIELAQENYRCWTGPKIKIDYSQIKEAVKLFKI